MARLQAHDWPGNIRELRNVLERARLFADDGIVRAEHLPEGLGCGTPPHHGKETSPPPARLRAGADDAELRQLATGFTGTRRELAARLGLSERTLYRRLKALGLA